jgi:hypothetical protein
MKADVRVMRAITWWGQVAWVSALLDHDLVSQGRTPSLNGRIARGFTPNLLLLMDMPEVARETTRQMFENILPAIRGLKGGPLVAALTLVLIDVARAQQWPVSDIVEFVKDTYAKHKSCDSFVKKTGQA